MAVLLSRVASDVVGILFAGTPGSYGSSVVDPRWSTAEVVDAVLTADAAVCAAIVRNKTNSRSQQFLVTQLGLAHGGQLGLNIAGRAIGVKFAASGGTYIGDMAAVEWELSEIQWETANPGLGITFEPHYFIDDARRIWHNGVAVAVQNGGSVSVNVSFPAFARTSACQSPDEYEHIVLAGAMSMMVGVEGENTGPQGTWAQQFAAGLQMVARGEGDVPRREAA